jgi:hypothetical protein
MTCIATTPVASRRPIAQTGLSLDLRRSTMTHDFHANSRKRRKNKGKGGLL